VPVAIAGTPITVQPGMVQGMVDYLNMGDVQGLCGRHAGDDRR
jgi:hypothetical protein